MWLDAADGVNGGSAVNGSAVSSWTDRSGNGNGASQSTTANQPQYVTNSQNGLPVILHDDVNDGMLSPLSLSAPYTLIVVERPTSATGGSVRTLQSNNITAVISCSRSTADNAFVGGDISDFATTDTAAHIATLVCPATGNFTYYIDAVNKTQHTLAAASWGQIATGAVGTSPDPANTSICEVLAYNAALTSPQLTQVWNYLKAKWATS